MNKSDVFELTLGEAVYFYRQIEQIEKRKQIDKIDDYLMQIAIVAQPHLKKEQQGKLTRHLQKARERLDPLPLKTEQEIEKGIELLKKLL